jgi:hypothetical protein
LKTVHPKKQLLFLYLKLLQPMMARLAPLQAQLRWKKMIEMTQL